MLILARAINTSRMATSIDEAKRSEPGPRIEFSGGCHPLPPPGQLDDFHRDPSRGVGVVANSKNFRVKTRRERMPLSIFSFYIFSIFLPPATPWGQLEESNGIFRWSQWGLQVGAAPSGDVIKYIILIFI